ncbi:MAG TPA: hypothetical protein VK578_12645 [Edaphobacter sp.]|nr:hypothetical protein [Edaphobacter sp.]
MEDFGFDREDALNRARSIALPIMFFRSVVDRLDKTINKTNEELRVRYPGPWEGQKQIVRLTFGVRKRIELGYGRTLFCTFALTADNSHIEALITDETEFPDGPRVKLLAFLLEWEVPKGNLGSCDPGGFSKDAEAAVKAYKMDLEPLPHGLHEVGPQEIAETVVAGIVRGYF